MPPAPVAVRSPRIPALVLAVAALASLLVPAALVGGSPAAAASPIDRLAGADRIATAVAVSARTWPAGADTVVLADGWTHADALAGGPAAAALDAPILLLARGALPAATATELARLDPSQVVVLGGAATVPDATLTLVRAATGASVTRVAGADRHATAAAVADRWWPAGARTAFLAGGAAPADALVAGPVAARAGAPLLLTRRDALPSSTAAALADLGPDRVVVLGGTAAVSDAVVADVAARTGAAVERIAGVDRWATAAAVTAEVPVGAPVHLAGGSAVADALAAAPAVARAGGVLLLAERTCVPPVVADEVARLGATSATLVGGAAVLADAVASLPRCEATPPGRWPGPDTTGIPAGTVLTPVYEDLVITTPGAVVEDLDLIGACLSIRADDVTVRRVRVTDGPNCGAQHQIDVGWGRSGILLEDVEVDGMGVSGTGAGIGDEGFTCRRCEIRGVGQGIHINSGVIEDSWIHSITEIGDSHNEAIITNGDARGIVIRNNRLTNENGQTAVISLFGDFGPIDDVLIEGNLLNGGGYVIYGGDGDTIKPYSATNVRIVDNVFGRDVFPGGGWWGHLAYFDASATGNVFRGNTWADTGEPVLP